MQHPDEGTIHSWLDGALSADEAARVEAHVKECEECAAAVAEARGFIAGASRILTALDNAPRGVIPASAPKKSIDPWVLRVAATVLVVAAGTLVVVRNERGGEQPTAAFPDSASITIAQPSVSAVAEATPATGPASGAADASMPTTAASNAPKALRTKTSGRDNRAGIPATEKVVLGKKSAVQVPQSAVESGYAQAAPSFDSTPVTGQVANGFVALDGRRSEPLKVVGTPRRIGAKVTLYEVAPGDTVTLTEAVSLSLEAVVVTGIGTSARVQGTSSMPARSSGAQSKERADAAAIAKASESSHAAGAPTPPSPTVVAALAAQAPGASTVHAITWTDSTTKHTLTLTGRMPEARLQEIKIRIERERAAAAAAAKKSP